MSRAVLVRWNGSDLPLELKELPAGRYVVEGVDEVAELSGVEDAGLEAAMQSVAAGRTVSHDAVMDRARRALDWKH
jgi:hypothetical protein